MIEWTLGSMSDGIHAQVGFHAGDGVRFAVVPESLTSAIGNIDEKSNVGVPGQWIFQVDGVNITVKCSSRSEGELHYLSVCLSICLSVCLSLCLLCLFTRYSLYPMVMHKSINWP